MNSRRWHVGHDRFLDLAPAAVLMGILNVTPDSFSDGGRFAAVDAALDQARQMAEEGAAIIDVGGESTRPGATAVSAEEEQRRVMPVIEALARTGTLISIDTYRADTARLALAAGAHIVNDVLGLQRDPQIAHIAARARAGLVIMHTGRERQKLSDPIADQFFFLKRSLAIAAEAGVETSRIVLDPGFGFAKETPAENLALIARFDELTALGVPLMAGLSRKRFLGAVTGHDPEGRDVVTAAANALLRLKGASLFRVHDVAKNRDALLLADAVLAAANPN